MKEPKIITTGFLANSSDRITSLPNVSFSVKSIAVVPASNPLFLNEFLVSAILGSQFSFRLSDDCSPTGSSSLAEYDILDCGDEELSLLVDSVYASLLQAGSRASVPVISISKILNLDIIFIMIHIISYRIALLRICYTV